MDEYIIPLTAVVNDEQLLEFAMSHICSVNSDEVHPVAEQIALRYILNGWAKVGKIEFTEEEVAEEYQSLIVDYVLTSLALKGLVDTSFNDDGELLYSLSEAGKHKVEGTIDGN